MSVSVYAGCPAYGGVRYNSGAVVALHDAGFTVLEIDSSLLTQGFNLCYCAALNSGADYFLLLHADVIPMTPGWPALMVSLAEANKCGTLSAVIPLKKKRIDSSYDESPSTSTALESGDSWHPRRLSLADVEARPETWTEPSLLANTGLMLVDLRQDFARKSLFTIADRLRVVDGKFVAEAMPEDWLFSRQVWMNGGTVWATRAVRCLHVGTDMWQNW